METHECLFCGRDLTHNLQSTEYVIPNALGGRIDTKNATCTECNSGRCRNSESRLINDLALLANWMDLPRDRKKPPVARICDQETGEDLEVLPGSSPRLAHNLQVSNKDAQRQFTFNLPSDSTPDAERFLRKLGIASPGEKVILRHEKNPPQNYQVSLANLQIHNDEVRIGIAKIAASFARFHGLPLGNKSLVAQALRSEIPVDGIVTPIPSVVLTVEAPRPEPIEHVLAIHFAKDARILLGYVRLFGIYEFVIQLDAKWAHDGRDTLYRYDLIHCCENIATISWSVSDNLILSWFAQRQETMAYAMDRAVCLKQWLGDRNKIWVSRAMHKAMERMLALMNTGVTETVASVEAMRVGNEVLKKYGLAMEFQ